MRSFIKKHKILLFITLPITLFILFSVIVYFKLPSVLSSDWFISYIEQQLKKQGTSLELNISNKSAQWSNFPTLELHTDFDKICSHSETTKSCFQKGSLRAKVRLGLLNLIRLTELGPVKIQNINFSQLIPSTKPEKPPEPSPLSLKIPSWISPRFQLHSIDIQDIRFLYQREDFKMAGTSKVLCEEIQDAGMTCQASLSGDLRNKLAAYDIRATLNLSSPSKDILNFNFDGSLREKLKSSQLLEFSIKASKKKESKIDFEIAALNQIDYFPFSLTAQGDISSRRNSILMQISGDWKALDIFKSRSFQSFAKLSTCQIEFNLRDSEWLIENCQIKSEIKSTVSPNLSFSPLMKLEGKLELAPLSGQIMLNIPKQETPSYRTEANIQVTVNQSERGVYSFELDPESKLVLELKKFSLIQEALSNTAYSIPAPFNVLDGELQLVSSISPLNAQTLNIPFTLSAGLKSKNQYFNFVTKGDASFTRPLNDNSKVNINFDTIINGAQYQLPELSFSPAPQLIPDPRIGKGTPLNAEEAKSELHMHWSGHVQTADKKPVLLVSNLLENPIPLGIDLTTKSDDLSKGKISILPSQLVVFRRKAQIKHLNATFQKYPDRKEPVIELSGNILVTYPDYLVTILLTGTPHQPKIILNSSPPLERRQILSLLLFGDVKDEFDSGENQSISDIDKAIAQGAISLASLYFLASTPIQSISYDPKSKSTSIRFKLGDKTSVSVTSNMGGEGSVGLRRKLGRNWAISTEMELQAQDNQNRLFSTFLEWFNRY